MSVTRSEISSDCSGNSSLSSRPLGGDAGYAAPTQRTRREPFSSENLKRGFSAICQTSAYSHTPPSTHPKSPVVGRRPARQNFSRPHPEGESEAHASILAAYLGSDSVTRVLLAQMASSLPQVDIVDHRLLRRGRYAQIVIVDCRDQAQNKYGRAKLSSELVQLALVAEGSLTEGQFSPTGTPTTCCGRR